MGKKRLPPLRKLVKSASGVVPTVKEGKEGGKGAAKAAVGVAKTAGSKKGKAVEGGDAELDDETWERIEAADALAAGHDEDDEGERVDGDDDDDETSDGDSDDGAIMLQGAVEHISEEFTFEFCDMRDEFDNGICTLLRSLVINPTDAYTLASAISAQTIVGTVIVCEGEADVFAFATVLPVAKQKAGPTLGILEHLRRGLATLQASTPRSPGLELLAECVGGAQGGVTGLFLHQRFSNLPLELIGHLHRNLDEDLGWAQQLHDADSDGGAQEISEFKSLQFVILLCCCDVQGGSPVKDAAVVDVSGSSALLFHNFEDDLYFQEAICTVLFRPKTTDQTMVASLIPTASLKKCALGISSLVDVVVPNGGAKGAKEVGFIGREK